MPRRKKQERRVRGTGSISVNKATGAIRVRLPADGGAPRPTKRFRPGEIEAARAYLAGVLAPPEPELPSSMSLGDWAGQWLELYVMDVRPPTTVRVYRSHLSKLEPEYATPVAGIRPLALQRIVKALTSTVAPRTVAEIAGVWKRCFEGAVQDELIPRNPARRLVLPGIPKKPPARHVSAAEVAKLRPAIEGERFAAVFALMLGCGLRIGEIQGLHREHVDRRRRRLWVQWQYTNSRWRDGPKGRNPHWAPIPPWAWAHVAAHLDALPPDDVLVFQSPYQSKQARAAKKPIPWSRTTIARDLDALVKRAGIDDLTPHASRHGLASYLMANRVSPAVIAELLGNTPGVVISTYIHATPEGREEASKLIDAYLSTEAVEAPEGTALDDMGTGMGTSAAG